ncbi:MAG: bifunctional glutamate N-acetyltransferase/amino-acid acetyltransferase ArgJ [Desulfobulbaceae bacterium]|uniref:Arginine biosynthesis bifunctional protein ArgJ n=1 Tax=Candidatus Desulfatifera sulfidica TaxID=2841691 RepID=A0A8J6N819_9BACT|nr:bifunctional glutamate N-acetyltransferase/amino-acid acetyltransferase ArgJ [Candidatus Desulfatifera sulfidica]
MIIQGFKTAAVAAGIKYQDRLDLGLIYCEKPAVTAGVFTTNQVKAAPVIIDQERLKQGCAQAVLVNSGCANACTGEPGMIAARKSAALCANALDLADEMVLISSTGVIGAPLNMEAIEQAMPDLVASLGEDNFDLVAQAIMTTDTVPKTAVRTLQIDGKEVNFMGVAKGAGMIMPNMATMLSFVITDAQISFPQLHGALLKGVERTFNRITIDGDTSTNDMVLVMASNAADNAWIDEENPAGLRLFEDTLEDLLKDLALQIVTDGEGATKMITIRVCNARSEETAEQIACTVANSSLVKTAFFGEDANWGRILAAMGRSGARFNPDRVDIAFGDVVIVRDGLAVGGDSEERAAKVLKEKKIAVSIDLKEGAGCVEVYTCDFSVDYVKINADYRT